MNQQEFAQRILESFQKMYRDDQLIVIAAGNFGPLPNTMSWMATLPWVLSVGASNKEGNKLAEFSSRGIPNHPTNKPDIVAPGINIISIWNINIEKSPEQQEKDNLFITPDEIYRQNGQIITRSQAEKLKDTYSVMDGTSCASAFISGLSAKLIEIREKNGLSVNPDSLIRIFKDMARPVDGYEEWEVGSGFVNFKVFDEYIENINRGFFGSDESYRLWYK